VDLGAIFSEDLRRGREVSHLANPTGDTGGSTLKKLVALAAAGILTLSVAAFAQSSAKTETKKEETKTMETKKAESGKMEKKSMHKKHHAAKKMEKKSKDSKPEAKEEAPKTN
jgi:uncharacterized protein HemX